MLGVASVYNTQQVAREAKQDSTCAGSAISLSTSRGLYNGPEHVLYIREMKWPHRFNILDLDFD